MRCYFGLAVVAVVLSFSAEAWAGLEGDAIVVSERFPTSDFVRSSEATLVAVGDEDAVVFPSQNPTTINVDPDLITLTFGCGFNLCNRNTSSAEYNGFAISDLDWSEPPGPPIGFEIESSLYFDPVRVELRPDEILIDAIYTAWSDQDFVRIRLIYAPQVGIDIVPRNSRNRVFNRGRTPVAILASTEIDISKINPVTLRFGPGEALASRGSWRKIQYQLFIRDVNRDGLDDLTVWFRTRDAEIPPTATEACLTGELDGTPFLACDSVEPRRPPS